MATIRFLFFWPGFDSAWNHGSARGLFVSVLFAWSLCLIMLGYLVWPDWISGWLLQLLLGATAIFWLTGWAWDRMLGGNSSSPVAELNIDSFTTAQREYLRGNWFEAEAVLLEIVNTDPGDMAAGLLLAGVLRRTQRAAAAKKQLDKLCLYDAAQLWRFEIERERQIVLQSEEHPPAESSEAELPDTNQS